MVWPCTRRHMSRQECAQHILSCHMLSPVCICHGPSSTRATHHCIASMIAHVCHGPLVRACRVCQGGVSTGQLFLQQVPRGAREQTAPQGTARHSVTYGHAVPGHFERSPDGRRVTKTPSAHPVDCLNGRALLVAPGRNGLPTTRPPLAHAGSTPNAIA